MDTSRPPHFDGTNFPYYKARMACYLVNKQANNGVKRFWMPKEIISNMKSTKKVWILKGK